MALSPGAAATAGVAGLLAGAACWLAMGGTVQRRSAALRRIPGVVRGVDFDEAKGRRETFVALCLAGGIIATVIGGPLVGLAAGSLAALAFLRVRSRAKPSASSGWQLRDRSEHSDVGVEWPAALDLLAACLCAGATLEHALRAVAQAFPGSIAELLGHAARLTALGAAPEDAWRPALSDPLCAPVARAVIRAHHSGAALTDVLNRVAEERRRALRAAAETAAAKAAVRSVLPLGACFLPAFVLAGVVPVVAGFIAALRG